MGRRRPAGPGTGRRRGPGPAGGDLRQGPHGIPGPDLRPEPLPAGRARHRPAAVRGARPGPDRAHDPRRARPDGRLLTRPGRRLGRWGRRRVGDTLDETVVATALWALVAVEVGDPLADEAGGYVAAHPMGAAPANPTP